MKRYIPNQHGAWAMLVLPFLFGLAASQGKWPHIPLFLTWLLLYLFSFPLLQWAKTRRGDRYRKPVMLYAALLLPFAIYMLIAVPQLIWFTLPLIPLFFVNLYYARTKNERALLNDIAAIATFSLMVFPVFYIGEGEDWRTAVVLFAVSMIYFTGTALYVKTIIREKKNPKYYYASIAYHLCFIVFGLWFLPLPAAPVLAALLLRAIVVPKMGVTPKVTGMIEIGFTLMLFLVVLFNM